MNKFTKAYQDLLIMAKILNYRVIHTANKRGAGWFSVERRKIALPLLEKNKLHGVYILAHEIGHAVDYFNGKFPKWYFNEFKYNEWIHPNYIRKFEKSANEFAKQFLRSRNISIKSIGSFQEEFFEGFLIPYWTLVYNGMINREDCNREIDKIYEEANLTPYWKKKKKKI